MSPFISAVRSSENGAAESLEDERAAPLLKKNEDNHSLFRHLPKCIPMSVLNINKFKSFVAVQLYLQNIINNVLFEKYNDISFFDYTSDFSLQKKKYVIITPLILPEHAKLLEEEYVKR